MMVKSIIASLILMVSVSGSALGQFWETDLTAAKEKAALESRPIVLVFQGSDWCAACMKLNEEIWKTNEFQEYAADHYVMLLADFPKKKKNALPEEQQMKNNKLAEQYNQAGYFPFVAVLDKEGKVLGTTGYNKMTPKAYIDLLNSFKS